MRYRAKFSRNRNLLIEMILQLDLGGQVKGYFPGNVVYLFKLGTKPRLLNCILIAASSRFDGRQRTVTTSCEL